jgi:hypothetical protein
MLHAIEQPADIQDRDGGGLVMARLFGRYPFLTKLFADGGYQGPNFAKAAARAMPDLSVEIVKRLGHRQRLRCLTETMGSSNAASRGSDAVGAWPRTSRLSTGQPWHSSASRPSA